MKNEKSAEPVVAEGVVYRSYRPGDEGAIGRLMRECGYDHDLRFWNWINRECPHGPAIVELALQSDGVVGHYAILPRPLCVNGEIVQSGLAIHAAVHPQWRGLTILLELMRRIVQRCREASLPFIYGFPNDRIWEVYLKVLQWRPIGDLAALELPLRDLKDFNAPRAAHPRFLFHEGAHFDERHEAMRQEGFSEGTTHVLKDQDYLTWRYADHPKVKYLLAEALTEEGDVGGFLVLKLYEKEGKRYGHIVDLHCRPGPLVDFPRLVSGALRELRRLHVEVASCWMPGRSPLSQGLQGLGFRATGFTTHMGYRLIDPNFPTDALGMDRWHTAMGDSDAF